MVRIIFVLLIGAFTACSTKEIKEPIEYTGPLREVEDMETYYVDQDKIKVKIIAALVYEFKSGDREFPKGIYLEFFDETGKMESTLKANHAYFFKDKNQWRGQGNVEVKNVQKHEQLNTEELFWNPKDKKIFTEKFVTIKQQGDVIYGQGLNANQDLSDYVITNPTGSLSVEE